MTVKVITSMWKGRRTVRAFPIVVERGVILRVGSSCSTRATAWKQGRKMAEEYVEEKRLQREASQ